MSSLWTGHPEGAPPNRPGERALALLSIPLITVGGGFTFYVTLLEVPGGLASWSLTVLAYGLWLWPGMPLMRRLRRRSTVYELTGTHARARRRDGQRVYREVSRDEWAELRLVEEPNGTWSVWPFDSKGGRATEPVFEGLREPDALRRALDDSTPSGE
ncbi:MAG: hypothetical protein CL940_01410 [Deltaproteobacteria bacterium]|nr:hypothetical protein [Deltaproteobacteria bacterium]